MVNIHNIMEELVINRANQLYDQVKSQNVGWLTCDCENCRLDTICYVLNRIPSRYVLSGRGITHNSKILEDSQVFADIDRLSYEGMKMVSGSKRPYHMTAKLSVTKDTDFSTPMFFFPTFIGNVFDGSTFEPLSNVTVTLKEGGITAETMDASWDNPTKTYEATKGGYSFWVAPEVAEDAHVNKEFTFTVEANLEGYIPSKYTFTVPLVSEKGSHRDLSSTYSLKIKDLFLFRTEIVNEQE